MPRVPRVGGGAVTDVSVAKQQIKSVKSDHFRLSINSGVLHVQSTI